MTLCQGTEADCICPFHQFDGLLGQRNVIPSNPFDDGVGRNTLFQFDQYTTCRIVNGGNECTADSVLFQFLDDLGAEHIIADGTDGITFGTLLGGVINKVDGCTTCLFLIGKDIPQ